MATIETSLPAFPMVSGAGLAGNQGNLQVGLYALLWAISAGIAAFDATCRIIGRRLARRIRRCAPRRFSADERADRRAVILHVQQRRSFIHVQRIAEKRGWASSKKESKELARLMSQKLGQLGLDYMFSMDGRKVRRFPQFSVVEISRDQYRFKIDSQRLPRDVSELDITKDEVIRGLECTIGKTIRYDLSEGGLWILVARMSGLRNIPR